MDRAKDAHLTRDAGKYSPVSKRLMSLLGLASTVMMTNPIRPGSCALFAFVSVVPRTLKGRQ
jgi:hypothetical protein